MPLVRISHPAGIEPDALSRGVQQARVDTFEVPADDLFQVVTEHGPGGSVRPESDLGIRYADQTTIVPITVSDTRTAARKESLSRAIVDSLARCAGLRSGDVLVQIVDVRKENWSFGRGAAQPS